MPKSRRTPRVLAALFTACLGATTPAWALDITVTDAPYNADETGTDDCSTAFGNALTAIVNNNGGTLIVPPGRYNFTALVSVNLKGKAVTIQGRGMDVSTLRSANTTGILNFTNSGSESRLQIYDITFSGTLAGSGCALKFLNNGGLSANDINSLILERVDFHGGGQNLWFAENIRASYAKQARFLNVIAANGFGQPASGFFLNHSESPYFENCFANSMQTGFDLGDMTGTCLFIRCQAVGAQQTGFFVRCRDAASGTAVSLQDCHSNAVVSGVKIWNADTVQIYYHLSYPQKVATYTDFIMNACTNVGIEGCSFQEPYCTTRTAISLPGTSNVFIRNNIFNVVTATHSGGTGVIFAENIINPAWEF